MPIEGIAVGNTQVRNPNYLIQIKRNSAEGITGIGDNKDNRGDTIIANMPEQLYLAAGSQWEARSSGSAKSLADGGGLLKQFGGTLASATNFDVIVQDMTYQIWQSSAPIEFNLTLLFDAYRSAAIDVVGPMRDLMAMSLPYSPESYPSFMIPPGPSVLEPNRSRVSIKLGRFMYIHSVIIKSVNNVFDTRFDSEGQPISGQSEITVATINTPSRQDVTRFYMATDGENTDYGNTTLGTQAQKAKNAYQNQNSPGASFNNRGA